MRKKFRFTNEERDKIQNQIFPSLTLNPKRKKRKKIMIEKVTSSKNRKNILIS